MIFGVHGGRHEKGIREVGSNSSRRRNMFCHSPESWRSLWMAKYLPRGVFALMLSCMPVSETVTVWIRLILTSNHTTSFGV